MNVRKCWHIYWLKIAKIIVQFNLHAILGRTASMQRGTAAQIARKSLSADYMLQSEKLFLHLKAFSNGRKLM